MRAADCFGTRLREAEVQDLPFFNQILNRSSYLFDWHFRVDPVLIKQIDAIGSQPLQRRLGYFLDVLWPAIETTTCIFKVKTKFGCDMNFVADRRERFSDKFFACIWAVNFSGIKQGDAFLMGCTNDLDALVSGCGRTVVGANAHAPEAKLRDL